MSFKLNLIYETYLYWIILFSLISPPPPKSRLVGNMGFFLDQRDSRALMPDLKSPGARIGTRNFCIFRSLGIGEWKRKLLFLKHLNKWWGIQASKNLLVIFFFIVKSHHFNSLHFEVHRNFYFKSLKFIYLF